MVQMLPEGSLIRLGDRDKELDRIEEAKRKAYENALPEDQWLQSLSAGILRENYTSRWVNEKINYWGKPNPNTIGFERDPDYHFEDDEENYGYNPMVMVDAKSAGEARLFRNQIDLEMGQLEQIAASNWGVTGEVFGSVFQPHVAASLAIAPVSLTAAIGAEVVLETASEAMLHSMERTRTLEESYWNVGLTAMGVGILGAAAKGLGKLAKVPTDVIDDINAGRPVGDTDSAGAARVVDDEMITAEEDALIGGPLARMFSIGQISHLVGSVSAAARDIAQRLADSPLFTRAHGKGKTRGVTVESLHEAAMGRVVIATDKAKALQKQSGLKANDFDKEVGVAMSNGDRSANPQVQAAAEMYRKEVLDPIQEAAERLGVLESPAKLQAKIKELEGTVETMAKGTKASKAEREALEIESAKYVTGRKVGLTQLLKKVEAAQKKLDAARKPGKDGKPRTASKDLIAKHNEARTKLSMHKKETTGKVAGYKARTKELVKGQKDLATARKDLRTAKTKAKNPVAFAESYFPRIYSKNAIYDNWDELLFKLEQHFKADPKIFAKYESGEITEMAIDTLQNMVAGRSQRTSGKGKPTALRARVLSMMDNELEQFLEKGASSVMVRHAQAMQPYLIMREAFDGRTMDEMLSLVDDDYRLLLADKSIDDKQRTKLSKDLQKDKDRLRVIHDRLMHQVQRAVNPGSAAERVTQFAKAWNTATYLGGVVLSSLPDLARPLANYGLRSYGKGLAKAFSQMFSGKGSISSIQVKRTGSALQRTLNDRVMQLTDSLEPESKFLQGAQKLWTKVSGFGVYTDIMESIAAHTAMDWTLRMAERLSKGKNIAKADLKQLTRMGLDAEDLKALYLESMETMGAQDSVLKYMNTMEWKDIDLAKRVEAAIGSDVRRTIIRIGVGEKPQFMDETTFSFLFQFQSFALSAQNKIMVSGLQNLYTIRTAESLVAMMALGAGVGATKGYLRGDDISEWPIEQWIGEGIDRSGMVGALRIPFNLLRYAGAQAGLTDAQPSRFVGREIEGAIAGPTASVLGRIFYRAPAAALEGDFKGAGMQLMKAMPFINNTWHVREVLTKLGDQ